MQALRLTAPALVLAAIFSAIFLTLGLASAALTPGEEARSSTGDHEPLSSTFEDEASGGSPQGRTLSDAVPAEDVRGEPIPGLPRYPGSVRVAYSEDRSGSLNFVRVRYVAEKPPDTVRDHYEEAFRTGGWRVANVEYSGGRWFLLGVHGGREAGIEVSPRGGGSTVGVGVSRPGAQEGGSSADGSKR